MKSLNSGIIILASAGLLLLGACSKEPKTTDSASTNSAGGTAATTPPTTANPSTSKESTAHSGSPKKGGQVVESGKYHLELVPEKEANKTHLDFYLLQGDNHEIVPNANVTADLQSPDGKQKTLAFNYDAKDKHYTAVVDDKATGQYQLKIIAKIGNEKVDGRFKFDR
jgi:major membrane immunogen (membrane-anchored lipoprotein)